MLSYCYLKVKGSFWKLLSSCWALSIPPSFTHVGFYRSTMFGSMIWGTFRFVSWSRLTLSLTCSLWSGSDFIYKFIIFLSIWFTFLQKLNSPMRSKSALLRELSLVYTWSEFGHKDLLVSSNLWLILLERMEHLAVFWILLFAILLFQTIFLNAVKHFSWSQGTFFLILFSLFSPSFHFHVIWCCLLDWLLLIGSFSRLKLSLISLKVGMTWVNGQKGCLTDVQIGWGSWLSFGFKISLFGDVTFENFLTKELKTLLDHFLWWVEYTLNFFKKLQDFVFENLRILAVLNHVDKVSSKEISFGLLVISDNELQGLLDELPETWIGLAVFVGNLVDDFLEDKVVVRVDVETFGVDIDGFDEVFLVFGFLWDLFGFLVVDNAAVFRGVCELILIVKEGFYQLIETVLLSEKNTL